MMQKQIRSLLILAILIVLTQTACKKNFWNEILYYEDNLSQKDYVDLQIRQTTSSRGGSDIYKGPFCIHVFSNRTFIFQIDYPDGALPLLIAGKAIESHHENSIYKFNLIASEKENIFKGQIFFNYTKNSSWVFQVELSDMGILLDCQVEVSCLYFQIAKIILIISMTIMLPITEKRRARMLYDIRVRTNIITVLASGAKVIFLISILMMEEGFLLSYYGSSKKDNQISTSSILMGLLILHLMIIFLLPLMMHSIYLMSVMFKWLQNAQKFKRKSNLLLMLAIILTFTFALCLSIFLTKGMLFHYIISLSIIPTLIHSAKAKNYMYGRFIIFDLLINFSFTLFGLYLPIYNFSLISYRQAALLWNFQLGLLIIGIIITKKIIAIEPQQSITAEQLACEMSPWNKRQGLQQNENNGTIQIIE